LVEYRNLPPDLERAGDDLSERLADLITALGGTPDQAQRQRLNQQLTALRDDLLELQREPHMAPLTC